jgi:uroporphyrin-III C-methyltransferase/precorrin-2 dehydrogenase/sirohydrochlorin ferrochelatase
VKKDVRVWLVGAGPGDRELLTVKAARVLAAADVVVHDRLVAPEILARLPRRVKRIYAGKQPGRHTLTQDEINRLLIRLARGGKRVVRLKGGDPFIFGRGGEEALALARAGIAFEVVPGITAATGVAAAVGIPLTHRAAAHACVLVTGSRRKGDPDLDWKSLARLGQTIVVYMGLAGLERVSRELIAHGLSPRVPAAIIQKGTTAGQRFVAGTLAALPRLAAETRLRAPTLIVIGKVVRLQRLLGRFMPQPRADRSAVRAPSGAGAPDRASRRTPRARRARRT